MQILQCSGLAFSGLLTDGVSKKALSLKSVNTYPANMKLGSYTLPKEDPKGCFDKHGYNFDVLQFSAKMSTLGLLKTKLF